MLRSVRRQIMYIFIVVTVIPVLVVGAIAVSVLKKQMKERYEELAKSFGMEFDEFLQGQMGINEEEFDKQAAQAAEQSVKSKLVTEAIAKKENISLSDEAYERELEKIVEQYGYDSVEALKEQVEEEELKASALNNLVVEELAKKCIQKADGK